MRARPKVAQSVRRLMRVAGSGAALLLVVAQTAGAATITGDPLTIYADGFGHMQVRFNDSQVGEFEPAVEQATGAGLTLDIGPGYPCGSSGNTPTNIDPAVTSGSGAPGDLYKITTSYQCSWSGAQVSAHQTLSYLLGDNALLASYDVKNEGAGAVIFRALAWGNLHHGQTTMGQGFYDATSPRIIAGYNDAQGSEIGLEEMPAGPSDPFTWSAFMEGDATNVFWTAGGLYGPAGADDTIDPTLQDDAIAVQFDDYFNSGLAPGASHTFDVVWYFARYNGLAIGPGSQQKTVGETAQLTATSLNHGSAVSAATVRYTVFGANPQTGAATTAADGTSAISLTAAHAGTDKLLAYMDDNGNGVDDPSETEAEATVNWAAAPAPPVTTAATPPPPPPPPDSAGAIRTGLKAASARVRTLKRGSLLRRRGFTFAFTAPAAGLVTGQITAPPATGGSAAKTRVLAKLSRVFSQAGKAQVTMKLTAAGVRALKRSRQVRATLSLTFKPTGGTLAAGRRTVSFRR